MDTLTLINRAHQGDKLARDKILIENTGLIWSIVRRFLNRGHEGEDLFQIGCIGMLKAIDRFDTEFDVAFFNLCSSNDSRRNPKVYKR
ncbi:MAG: sigma factor [Eubacterium ventriosum]